MDSFHGSEFWYADPKKQSFDTNSFHRSEDKWWIPVPCMPENGLPERARKELQQKRDCANQIHKAAMAINNAILAEMDVPDSYLTTLPKVPHQFTSDYIIWSTKFQSSRKAKEI